MAITDYVTAIGTVLTGIGLIFAGVQLQMSRKISRSEFLMHFKDKVQEHNQVHLRLRGAGWPDGRDGPETDGEWLEVSQYMGLLEGIQILIEDRILHIKDVDRLYSHRVFYIVNNEKIRRTYLEERAMHWHYFLRLWHALEDQPVYQHLVSQEKLQPK
jgi:hypothetical protein